MDFGRFYFLEDVITDYSVVENGKEFKTGKPVTFEFIKNTEKAPNLGTRFQQDIEPHGYYVVHNSSNLDEKNLPPKWIKGQLTFNNPLVLPFNIKSFESYDENSWKSVLAKKYNKKGKALSTALKKDGYDGIVTLSIGPNGKAYDTREIIGL